MPRGCIVVRVFTRGDEGGNHLGVVNDIADLDAATMQSIAADLGFSETVFVDWEPRRPARVRIFTPADELPFAGHPLVGTGWVMNMIGPGDVDRLSCEIGEVGVRIEDEMVWVDVPMTATVTDSGSATEFVDRSGIKDATRVDTVELPLEYVLVELPSFEAVATLAPDMDVLAERFGTMAYARQTDQVRARFFAPRTAVPEDPATGSAAVALATLLATRGELNGRLTIAQGEEIGHPSRIALGWADGVVSIGGTVVRDESRMLDT